MSDSDGENLPPWKTPRSPTAAADITVQIERLRDQVEALMRDRVTPAIADAAGRAESAVGSAQEVLSDKVRERPLLAVGVAAAIGYVLGALIRK